MSLHSVVKFWTTTLIYKSSSTMCRCRGEFNLRVGMQDLNLAILLFLAVKGLAWVRQVSDRCQKSVWEVSEFQKSNLSVLSALIFGEFSDVHSNVSCQTAGPNSARMVCDSETFVKMRFPSCCGDLPTQAQWSRCIHLRYTSPWEVSSSLIRY